MCLETHISHGGVLSLFSYDSTCESGMEENSVTQIIAEDKRQVPRIMQFVVEISFRKPAVKSLNHGCLLAN